MVPLELQAQQRLNILATAVKCLQGPLTSKTAQVKLQKALDRLQSVPKLQQVSELQQQQQQPICIDLEAAPEAAPDSAAKADIQAAPHSGEVSRGVLALQQDDEMQGIYSDTLHYTSTCTPLEHKFAIGPANEDNIAG